MKTTMKTALVLFLTISLFSCNKDDDAKNDDFGMVN